MSTPTNHHWIPEFLLKKWEVAPARIPTWSLEGPKHKLYLKDYSAKSICSEKYLYSLVSEIEVDKERIEKEYLQKIDNDASTIVDKIEARRTLTEIEKYVFLKFIYCFHLRNPETIKRMEKYSEDKKIIPNLISRAYSLAILSTQVELPKETMKLITHDAVRIAICQGAYRDTVYNLIQQFKWHFIRIDEDSHSLPFIISDQPLVVYNGLVNPDSEIFLPLGPRLLFWATRQLDFDPHSLNDGLPSEIANNQQTFSAFERVFGTADRTFIEKKFAERLRLVRTQPALP